MRPSPDLRSHLRLPAVVVALVLSAAACSDGEQSTTTTVASDRSTTTAAPATSTTTGAEGSYTSAIDAVVVDNPAFDEFERRILDRLRLAELPGAGLLVVQGGELVEHEAWLDYDIDTVVPIASGSKWLSAATIMTLVDEGLIELDAPLTDYLDGERIGPVVGKVTMRQLLSFTSGLEAKERIPCLETGEGDLQSCARDIVGRGIVHPPGEQFRYGSQHLHVAAAVAERVSGTPFAELFQERIARPLGMDHTAFAGIGTRSIDDVTHPLPAGSAISSMSDYGRFLEMLVHDGVAPDGTRILSAESVAEMHVNQTEDARYGTAAEFRVASDAPYALGNWVDWTDRSGAVTVSSSDGAFGFRPWIDRSNDLFGVYLIEDHGTGYVEGDPEAPGNDQGKVHTSGLWIFEWTAEALGGSLPDAQYPHRREG